MNQAIEKAYLFFVCGAVTWTLLISPASAQVNGPGPSPSSTFDIVLNLPGDEAVITGTLPGEMIGMVAGETTQLNVSDGGVIGALFLVGFGAEVNFSGGSAISLVGGPDSELNISGGTVAQVITNAVADISGGAIGSLIGGGMSSVNIQGTGFLIDGTPVSGLQPGQSFTITDRDVTLSGVLADGEPFSFDLNSAPTLVGSSFDPAGTLAVTLDVPVLLGDCNLDGMVSFLDINPFIMILAGNMFLAQADCNQDGVVSFLDIQPFIQILAGN